MHRGYQVGGTHYAEMEIQPFDFFDTQPLQDQMAYHKFTAIAYLMRAGRKGDALEDIRKAIHHLEKIVDAYYNAADK